VKNSVALEVCAEMGLGTWQLNAQQSGLPGHILDKHYLRKHGAGAYYGQG
jgi:L-ribulose-5-phosphate 4-epimerase